MEEIFRNYFGIRNNGFCFLFLWKSLDCKLYVWVSKYVPCFSMEFVIYDGPIHLLWHIKRNNTIFIQRDYFFFNDV